MVINAAAAPPSGVRTRIRAALSRLRSSASGPAPRTSAPTAPALETSPERGVASSTEDATSVTTSDGVRLHVEVSGDPRAPLTVVLCHGYLADSGMWLFHRASLGGSARVVTYDHRGHGRSEVGEVERLSLDQIGEDLAAVIEQTAPSGPVVLVGHSMGGMAVMTLAEQRPDLFDDRVVGVGLVTTAATPVNGRAVLPPRAANVVLSAIDRMRLTRVSCCSLRGAAQLVARGFALASRVPPSVVDFVLQLTRSDPVHALVAFVPQFLTLDKRAALPVLAGVEALVVGAEHDEMIAPAHSGAIASALPGARLAMIPNAGHMVPVEHPEPVGELIHDLLTRATARRATPS